MMTIVKIQSSPGQTLAIVRELLFSIKMIAGRGIAERGACDETVCPKPHAPGLVLPRGMSSANYTTEMVAAPVSINRSPHPTHRQRTTGHGYTQ